MRRPDRHGILFSAGIVFLLLISAACRILGKSDVMPLTLGYIRNLILIGLSFAWGFSVRKRIVQRSARRYLTLIAALIVFWMTERTSKYLFLFEMPVETRYAWYLFYVPMVFIPVLGIFAADCMGEPDDYSPTKKMYFLFLPAAAAVIAVLTNDLHQLVFEFPGGVPNSGNDYSYGPLYFAVMALIVLSALLFLFVLLRKSRIPGRRRRILMPAGVLLIALIYGFLYIAEIPLLRFVLGDMTAVFCLLIIAVFESCAKIGLFQSNRRYDELFDIATVGAQITDTEYIPVLSSANSRAFPADILREAEKKPILLEDGYRLSGQPIRGGHTFWLEDVSRIASAISELEDINDTLEDGNAAKREENNTLKQKTRLRELNRMYNKMQLQTQSQIHRLGECLDLLAATDDPESEKRLLGSIMMLGAYIKRRNNLLCILESQTYTEASDLDYCLRESIEAMQLRGVECGYSMQLCGNPDVRVVMRLYDAFETVLERTCETVKRLFATVEKEGEDFILLVELCAECDALSMFADGFICENEGKNEWLLTYAFAAEEGEEA